MYLDWLTLVILAFSVIQNSHSEVLQCKVPNNFSIELSPGMRTNYFDTNLQVSIDLNLIEFHSFNNSNVVHIKAKNVAVGFKGQAINEITIDSINTVESGAEKVSHSFLDQISGIAKRLPVNETSSMIYDCRLVLFPSSIDSFSGKISNDIRRVTESCIENVICARFARLERWKFIESYENSIIIPLPAAKNVLDNDRDVVVPTNIGSFQSIINKITDIALAEVVATLKQDDNGMIGIPDVEEDFSTGKGILKTNGKINAYEGKFGNLATLKRIADVVLSSKGYRYEGTCAFALAVTKLFYKQYKLKYGMIKLDGHIDAAIDGISLGTSVSIDYTQTPCIATVQKMEVIQFGKIKVDISGLGPLNSMAGSIFGWIGEEWKKDITNVIETKLTSAIQQQLDVLNCERFRP